MNTRPVIMIQISYSDHQWTLEALHCACLMARNTSAQIALVMLIPVQHPGWLGTNWGYMNFTAQQQQRFADCQATIEDYGLEFTPVVFQYISFSEALMQAAEQVNAQQVFAHIPHSIIPLYAYFQKWLLKRQFAHQQRQWIQSPVYAVKTSKPISSPIAEAHHP